MDISFKYGRVVFDFENGTINSLIYNDIEVLAKRSNIFFIRLMNDKGESKDFSSVDFRFNKVDKMADKISSQYYLEEEKITVFFNLLLNDYGFDIEYSIKNGSEKIIEFVEVLPVVLKPLAKNNGIGKMVFPFNEGVLIDDVSLRNNTWYRHSEIEYPSYGHYPMFPNMVFAQFLCYLFNGHGLYIGAQDDRRAPKQIEYYPVDEDNNIKIEIRLYSGKDFGEDFDVGYKVVYKFFDGDWHDGAEIYKKWIYEHLPQNAKKVKDNDKLPSWYSDYPVILTYPVRGYHDMDVMNPNELFPYINVLPYVDKYSKATGCKILVLLMHWEGTAPWAPPYVWPPYGGEEEFDKLFRKLKEQGHLLGVYCSGFSYTEKSNLVDNYDLTDKLINDKSIFEAFCAGKDGKILKSNICPGQRSGYDLCVASKKGREILSESYDPLLNKHLDYIQILDQNHGGAQYICYSREHGHPASIGGWMTESMLDLQKDWKQKAEGTLLGCESAASEPYIGNLLFSDNRFEIDYDFGNPIPLYGYIFHEFLHNFMGNQVSCKIIDSANYRIAYSFLSGDFPTLILNPKGFLQAYWGQREMNDVPNEEEVLTLISNLKKFYDENVRFMCYGSMIKPLPYECGIKKYNTRFGNIFEDLEVISSAYKYEEEKMQLFINYNKDKKSIKVNDKVIEIEGLSIIKIEL